MSDAPPPYRGRLAPSPTGYLHLGHARTFWIAQERAAAAGGALILRSEDLDQARCRAEFRAAMLEDLRWFGLRWSEGPDVGGPHAPYTQSERMAHYTAAFEKLRARGVIYPCNCSRQDVLRALGAPHAGEDEPLYPGTCRPRRGKLEIPNPKSEFPPTLRSSPRAPRGRSKAGPPVSPNLSTSTCSLPPCIRWVFP